MKKIAVTILILILAIAGYFSYDKYFGKSAVAGAPLRGTVIAVNENKVLANLAMHYQSNRDGQRIIEFEQRVVVIGEETKLVKNQSTQATILDIKEGLFIAVNPRAGEEAKQEFTAIRFEIIQ